MSTRQDHALTGTQVVRALVRDGFQIVGSKGRHCKLRRGRRTVIVPLHEEIRPATLASILRATGVTSERLRQLL